MLCTDISMLAPSHCGGGGERRELSLDPRLWSRDDVKIWLHQSEVQFQLQNTYPERFPMNGKGILLLTREMFLDRVPVGGGLLYEDVHHKLQKVISDQLRQAQELELMLRSGIINH